MSLFLRRRGVIGGFFEPIDATGGTVTIATIDGTPYKIHSFTGNGVFTVNSLGTSGVAEYLVVGGGGGGGTGSGSERAQAGNGGAGGLLTNSYVAELGGVNVVVGGGGSLANGGNSSFGSITAIGGGRGGNRPGNGSNGGSGGGAGNSLASGSRSGGAGIAGPPRQGHNGGGASSNGQNWQRGGGGGGAGGAGTTGTNSGGTGLAGPGLSVNFRGTTEEFARGGGYSPVTDILEAGGIGGGGTGQWRDGRPAHTPGKAGIVIIRYPLR